jgi:2C-methyl-D-erythritol 2,4-cyclodiphosphate synthase
MKKEILALTQKHFDATVLELAKIDSGERAEYVQLVVKVLAAYHDALSSNIRAMVKSEQPDLTNDEEIIKTAIATIDRIKVFTIKLLQTQSRELGDPPLLIAANIVVFDTFVQGELKGLENFININQESKNHE